MYELKEIKKIDGYTDCTYFEVEYVLDENIVVGNYGILAEDGSFVGIYGSATCLKSDLVDYIEE